MHLSRAAVLLAALVMVVAVAVYWVILVNGHSVMEGVGI